MKPLTTFAAAAVLMTGGAAAAQTEQSQSQVQTGGSQYSTQNNGTTFQSQYQVNSSNGAAQGSGVGNSQAQADYGASSSIRSAPAYPPGSLQTQEQRLGTSSSQTSTTRAPRTDRPNPSARPM
jgi:hypothetical protein